MKNTVRTPFLAAIRKAFKLALLAEKQQTNAAEIIGQAQQLATSRRKFLENTGKIILGGTIAPGLLLQPRKLLLRPFSGGLTPRIVIVGGGIAGLNALHVLKKNKLEATLYEATGRTGGRMFTVQEAMGKGTWTEFGGEFIDTDHADMWALAKEFNIELIDYQQASEAKLEAETFFFEGKHYNMEAVVTAFRTFAPRLKADMDKLDGDFSYLTTDPFIQKLDKMSLRKYLKNIGARGWIKRLIEVAYESEYGLSPKVQSSLNLTLLISPDTSSGSLAFFGDSDERYKARGGNQSIVDALARKYAGDIRMNRPLESIRQDGNSYNLHFGGMHDAVQADFVILALPFTKLRSVDMQIEMPPVKRTCIDTLGYGTNSKLMLGMKSHFWRKQGYGGLVYSDIGIPNGWDNAQLQTGDDEAAGLSILFGGPCGVKLGEGTPDTQKNKYLPLWERIFPGSTEQFNGKVARMHWPSYPYVLGSYICYTRGQYTSISGAEQMPVGNILFAGEHCGGAYAGFMNGAAQSGREAAEMILSRLD
ncbi:MAG: FAD-dependent oxidoreductase [Lewinellaceae bacterium]|nr:FAD-dependent oxidoreductase [Lewinellaceae bacterium]